ncbi:MAG: response regulator [Bacteroidia bacterium]|nr:response regulator [Bacteroidia bacterium]
MKAIIVDDERLARMELKKLLEKHSDVQIIGECADYEEAVQKINDLGPDLVFMDIQLPGKNGFDVIQNISVNPEIIFVTAHDEFAIKAFETNALDYLLKPVDPERLSEALQKFRQKELHPEKLGREKISADDFVFIKDGEKCWFVRCRDIRLFESDGNYVRIYFDNFKPILLRSLNSLEEKLDPKIFFRASRKHIINFEFIESIFPWYNNGLLAKMKDGKEVEFSRRQAIRFKAIFGI